MKKIEINNETNELNYYFAGYFDSRGSISIGKHGKKKLHAYQLKSSCCFDNKKQAELFKMNFGGTIQDNRERKISHWKGKLNKTWEWKMNNYEFIDNILPYILGKKTKQKLELAKKFFHYKKQYLWSHSPKVRAGKRKMYLQMRRLNK